jgi:ferredoxin
VRVTIDRDVCFRHARCVAHCPEVFGVDDEGYAMVRIEDVPAHLRARVLEAADRCPEGAVSVTRPKATE